MDGFGLAILLIIGVPFVAYCFVEIGKPIHEHKEYKKAEAMRNEKLETAKANWKQSINKLNIPTNSNIVWRCFQNSDDCYSMYMWREKDNVFWFNTEPTNSTAHFEEFQYPENAKKLYAPLSEIKYYYRTGTQGSYAVTDYSEANALKKMSQQTTGLTSLHYANKSLEATMNASTQYVKYDKRRTILEYTNGKKVEFHIDAFYVFQKLMPEKCR